MIKWIFILATFAIAQQANNKEIVVPNDEPSVLGYVYPSYHDDEIIVNYLKLHPQADTVLYVNSKNDTVTSVTKHFDYRKTQEDISSMSTSLSVMAFVSVVSLIASVTSIIVVAVHK